MLQINTNEYFNELTWFEVMFVKRTGKTLFLFTFKKTTCRKE